MILPIVGYGDPLLKKRSVNIDKNYSGLKILIRDMYETMYNASGVGLAAPQIGKGIRLFIIDTSAFDNDEFKSNSVFKTKSVKKAFINPEIINESGDFKLFEEGCLSIPNIRDKINRKSELSTKDQVLNWVKKEIPDFAFPHKTLKSGRNKGQLRICNESYDMADAYVIGKSYFVI